METLLGSMLDGNDDVLLVDIEFSGSCLLQLSSRNARGELPFSRTVDHQMPVLELFEKAIAQTRPLNVLVGPLSRFYGAPSPKPNGVCDNTDTVVDIFKEIEQKKIIQPQHKILERSLGRCDYRYIYAAAGKAHYTHLMPSLEQSICCNRPLGKTMPGLFSFSLPILFYMIDPN